MLVLLIQAILWMKEFEAYCRILLIYRSCSELKFNRLVTFSFQCQLLIFVCFGNTSVSNLICNLAHMRQGAHLPNAKRMYLEQSGKSGLSLSASGRECSSCNAQQMKWGLQKRESSVINLTLGMRVQWQSDSSIAEGMDTKVCSIIEG